jgi:hypothetical protein
MQRIYRVSSITCLAILLSFFLSIPKTTSGENTCWLEAADEDLYLTVYDVDQDDNILSTPFQGLITRGQKIFIQSVAGRLLFYYNISPDTSSSGIQQQCKNNEILKLRKTASGQSL